MTITITISNEVRITPLVDIPDPVLHELKDWFSLQNPAWIENERRGFSNYRTPRIITGYRCEDDALILPRGTIAHIAGIFRKHGALYRIADRRRAPYSVRFEFTHELRNYQTEALEACAPHDFATLCLPPGAGKTVIALALVARRGQPTLIVVHTRELLNQWRERIETFLGIPAAEIGVIANGKINIGERITVAVVNTVYQAAQHVKDKIGFLIVDECHRCPARTFTQAITAFDCRYMLGLSATPWRRDGLTRLINWYLGRLQHVVKENTLIDQGYILPVEVVERDTDFSTLLDPTEEYSNMLSDLCGDFDRNCLIANDVAAEASNGGGVCLVLTDRRSHCETLVDLLQARGVKADLLTGELATRERQRVVEDLNAGKVKVLIATGQLIGEGFDCKELSTLFLATPIKFDGRLIQYLGRIMRPASGKTEARVYDYHDQNVPVLRAQARSRACVFARRNSQAKGEEVEHQS